MPAVKLEDDTQIGRAIAAALGDEVATMIADRGWTRADTAHRLGWDDAQLDEVLAGTYPWNMSTAFQVADVFVDDQSDPHDEFTRLIVIARHAFDASSAAAA